jgi:hypothetical protein
MLTSAQRSVTVMFPERETVSACSVVPNTLSVAAMVGLRRDPLCRPLGTVPVRASLLDVLGLDASHSAIRAMTASAAAVRLAA